MIHRELIFTPETERTRDLVYTECASNGRSIHVLMQDNSIAQYRFLLAAYREIVRDFQSSSRLDTPLVFLKNLTEKLERLSLDFGFTVADFQAMGFYVLLRTTGSYYLLASRCDSVYAHVAGELLPIVDATGSKRVHLDDGALQEELFPQRMRDCVELLALDPKILADKDIVLGCGEEDKGSVLESLVDPIWIATAEDRSNVISKFITRKILAVRFEAPTLEIEAETETRSRRPRVARQLAWVGGVAVFVAIAGLWVAGSFDGFMTRSQRIVHQRDSNEPPIVETDIATNTGTSTPVVSPPASEAPVTMESPADRGEVLKTRLAANWKQDHKEPVTSSPALFESWVVFGGRDGMVYALDRQTGERAWAINASAGIGASPAIVERRVIVADYSGAVRALDVQTGTEVWKRVLPGRVVSSPTAVGDRVLVGCYDGVAYCLAASDGSILWQHKTGARIRASIAAANNLFFVPSYDGFLYALDANDGEALWRHGLNGQVASSPAFHEKFVVIGAPDGDVVALDTQTGNVVWSHKTDAAVKAAPTVSQGRVYVGSNDRHIYCLDANDGSLIWRHKTGDVVLARPAVKAGRVYVGSYDGFMYCLDAEKGTMLDRYQTDGSIFSSPVVDGSSVYFGNNSGSFICLAHADKTS